MWASRPVLGSKEGCCRLWSPCLAAVVFQIEDRKDNDGNRYRGRGLLQGRAPGWTRRHSPEPRGGFSWAGDGTVPPGTEQYRSALPAVGGAKRVDLKRYWWYFGNSTVSWWNFCLSGSERYCDLTLLRCHSFCTDFFFDKNIY